MRKQILITILLVLWLAFTVWAADMTITIPDADVPRVQEAYGSIMNLGRPATFQEVNRAIVDWLHNSTLDYERRKNIATYTPPPMHFPTPVPSPTPGGLQAGAAAAPQAVPAAAPKATPTPTPKQKSIWQ